MTEEKKKKYLTKFDEIEIMTLAILLEVEGESERQRIKRIQDEVLDILIDMYLFGFEEGKQESQSKKDVDRDEMYASIFKNIAGKTFEDRIREYVIAGTIFEIARVIDTESHRVLNEGKMDSLERNTNMYKRWITMRDLKVRETHEYLEGMKVRVDERFYTFDGDSALYPGDFENAENNVNCRCVIELTPR